MATLKCGSHLSARIDAYTVVVAAAAAVVAVIVAAICLVCTAPTGPPVAVVAAAVVAAAAAVPIVDSRSTKKASIAMAGGLLAVGAVCVGSPQR